MTEVNPEQEALEAEVIKDEVQQPKELAPLQTINNMTMDVMDIDPDEVARRAERIADSELRLRKIALKMTNKSDWVDEGGRPYLQWSGAARVASTFGVSYYDLSTTKDEYKDEKGEYIIFECKGKIAWRGRQIEEIGTGSTRDPFFAARTNKQTGEKFFLPLSEVDIPNIKKKAQTNFLNRGLKSIAGLSFTWEEVTEATGLKPEDVGGKVNFDKKQKNLGDPKRNEIKKMLVEMHGKSASVTLQALTTFKSNGNTIPGKQKVDDCSDAQIKHLYPKVKSQYDEFKSKKKD